MSAPWWLSSPWSVTAEGLCLDGAALAPLAERRGGPLYVYSATAIRTAIAALRAALSTTGLPFDVYYAAKANRFGPVLSLMQAEGVGIDACSPREVERALAHGFRADQISFTGSFLSDRDLDALVAAGVHVNLDAPSALRRYAARAPRGSAVGLRLDPSVRISYDDDPKVAYGGTKFGLLPDEVEPAMRLCAELGLRVDVLHVHLGWGLPAAALDRVEPVLAEVAAWARRWPSVTTINLGGGLGARRKAADQPMGPEHLAPLIRRHLGPLGLRIAVEPGTLLVDRAGALVMRVSCLHEKGPVTWVGVDAGHAINVYAAHYGLPGEIVHARRPLDPPARVVHVAGHINEANDVFARDVALPAVDEGDWLALLPAGAYGSSMASDHCLRGGFVEMLLPS